MANGDIQDQGTFIFYLAGRVIGAERFQIRASSGKIDASATIKFAVQRGARTFKFTTYPDLILNDALDPLTYRWVQKGSASSSLQIDFRPPPARVHYHAVNGGKNFREFYLPRNVVILDDNVVDQYELLVRRYLMTARGKQTFSAFIPQEGLPGHVTVTSAGSQILKAGGHKILCRHLIATTSLARIDLWVDSRGRLVQTQNASARFTAVRKY